MNKRIIITAAFFGALAVILGAFGAHALKKILSVDSLDVWHTAVQYHFYHTFALLFLSTFARYKNALINFSSYCFTGGILLFSGSLYILSLKDYMGWDGASFLGPVTPIGGLLFILGWLSLLLAAFRDK
ncbi:DUF423 domain-containing protein [Pedobacter glucosidilyticus]|uniref:DUF423 domain-containing protein n=1 Tax=Pedobacter glucosidilyticus TaxID=1122941 RepID=UPI000419E14D|nr:DUF423 domain-containing protein [Pedobacter glucosidilyticus]